MQSYRLIYEIHAEVIDVLAFVHGARELAAWWEREQGARFSDPQAGEESD